MSCMLIREKTSFGVEILDWEIKTGFLRETEKEKSECLCLRDWHGRATREHDRAPLCVKILKTLQFLAGTTVPKGA